MDKEVDFTNLFDLLHIYYKILFPYKLFYKWLSYGQIQPDYFNRREFSFTLQGDIYIRYLSFNDAEELRYQLLQKNPIKIDIGAVFNIFPKNSKKQITSFQPLERELIFDIDLTDYNDVRTCCQSATICNKCWKFMVIAAKILNRVLREDFGFKNILFVYSGRRGIHCWVVDERARKLTFEGRSAISDYLTLVEGGEFKGKKVNFNSNKNLHFSITEALKIIDTYFFELIEDQKWFENKEKIQKILSLYQNSEGNEILEKLGDISKLKPINIWKNIEKFFKSLNDENAKFILEEIKIQLCYLRLDINVSKGLNHLLKAPFCVHPKTGRICVPINFNKIDSFDPLDVPQINQLCDELDTFDEKNHTTKLEDYEKTSLRLSINFFKNFVNNLFQENLQIKLKIKDENMTF